MWVIRACAQHESVVEDAVGSETANSIAAKLSDCNWSFGLDEENNSTWFEFQFLSETSLREDFEKLIENEDLSLYLTDWSAYKKNFSLGGNPVSSGGAAVQTDGDNLYSEKESIALQKIKDSRKPTEASLLFQKIKDLNDREKLDAMVAKKKEEAFETMFKLAPLELINVESFLRTEQENLPEMQEEVRKIVELQRANTERMEKFSKTIGEFSAYEVERALAKIKNGQMPKTDLSPYENDLSAYEKALFDVLPSIIEQLQAIRKAKFEIAQRSIAYSEKIGQLVAQAEKTRSEELKADFLQQKGEIYRHNKDLFFCLLH